MNRIVLEGCNGDWSKKRYLPVLAELAGTGEIDLTIIDIVSPEHLELSDSAREAYAAGKIRYIDKKSDPEAYQVLHDIDRVFIVVPDRLHCATAEGWLPRLSSDGKIFLEKPLDASVSAAEALMKQPGAAEKIYAFDHYCARVAPFLKEKEALLAKAGEITGIECRFLESGPVAPWRIETLDKGAMFDLLCHIIPVAAEVCHVLTPAKLAATVVKKTLAARYTGSPISGETFARTEMVMGGVPVTAFTGFCVASDTGKQFTFTGTRDTVVLDFTGECFYTAEEGKEQGRSLRKRHVEEYIEAVVGDDLPLLSEVGLMDYANGFEVLKLLEKSREIAEFLPDYPCGSSEAAILNPER